jgi:hypothetical protein
MRLTSWRLAVSLPIAFASTATPLSVRGDDATRAGDPRAFRSATPAQEAPVRFVQFGVHNRYPFAQSRGAYRYPFNYPYYRYSPRQYPFGDGPYGPYGSNYGGYSGNAYDPGVYRSRPYFNAPQQFPDAERFDAGRKPNHHLAFGQGDHACSGMNVARMEARIALGRLLARFAKIELSGAPERDRRIRFRGFRRLPVRVS